MYLSKITGNILNKFNNQKINVLYQPQRNMFDLLLSECGIRLYIDKRYEYTQTKQSNIVQVTDDESNLFNYNVGITNNIIGYSSQKIFTQLHLNSIIFTHSYKPKQVKKEDLVLINNNLTKEKKIFFSQDVSDSWDLISNKIVIKYGIPTDKFYIDNNDSLSKNNILLLNFEKQPAMENFAAILIENGLTVDIVEEMNCNIDLVRDLFNKYKIVIDFNEHNITNLLCAVSCGCHAITYMTEMTVNNYSDTPNIYLARSIKDIIDICKVCLPKQPDPAQQYIEKNFPFNTFKDKITNMVHQANNEVFVI